MVFSRLGQSLRRTQETESTQSTPQRSPWRRTWPACHPGKRNFGEILEELRLLGLAGSYFTPEQYADALARILGIHIYLIQPDDTNARSYKAIRRRYGSLAGLRYVPECGLALIELPKSFDGIQRLMLFYHELSHLAAGHPIPEHRIITETVHSPGSNGKAAGHTAEYTAEVDEFYELPFRLSRREPPERELCELDADLRARQVLRASVYGIGIYDRVEHFLGMKDHTFPWPTVTPADIRDIFR